MKVCECGGMLYRHGVLRCKTRTDAERYKCRDCGKSITVREGEISNGRGPRARDWRTESIKETGK